MDDLQVYWRISAMDCYAELSGQQNYVFNVHWDCLSSYSGISGGPIYGRVFGTTITTAPENSGIFIPFNDLKESDVLSWVWDTIGETDKNNHEQMSLSQIYNRLNPPIVSPPLPWSTGTSTF